MWGGRGGKRARASWRAKTVVYKNDLGVCDDYVVIGLLAVYQTAVPIKLGPAVASEEK